MKAFVPCRLFSFFVAGCAASGTTIGQGLASFGWKQPQDGAFSQASNWDTSDSRFQTVPFVNLTATIPPRAGDIANFRDGTYAVNMAGAPSLSLIGFEQGTEPRTDSFFVTLNLAGDLSVNEFITPAMGNLTIAGAGQADLKTVIRNGAQITLKTDAMIGGVTPGLSIRGPDPDRNLFVDGGHLRTTGGVGFYGVTVDKGTWEHSGPLNDFGDPAVTLLNGATFTSDALNIRTLTRFKAQSGSTANIKEFNRDLAIPGVQVQLSSGSKLLNQNATAGSAPNDQRTFAEGAGTEWRVAGTLTVAPASGITIRRQAALSADTAVFDGNAFGVLTATNADSALSIKNVNGGNAGIYSKAGAVVQLGSAVQLSNGSQFTADGTENSISSRFSVAGTVSGSGGISASNGGIFSAQDVKLNAGRVSAIGPDSNVNVTNAFTLEGGNVSVSSGGVLKARRGSISAGDGGASSVNLDGASSTATFGELNLGNRAGNVTATLIASAKLALESGSTNWLGNAVGSDVRVIMNSNAQLDASQAKELVIGRKGSGSINLQGGKLIFGDPQTSGPPLPDAGSAEADCKLSDTSGPTVPDSPKLVIGGESDGQGAVALSGTAVVEVNGQRFYVGDKSASASLTVRNGARVNLTVPLMTLGKDPGARGRLTVDGPASMVEGIRSSVGTGGTQLEIGRRGEGTLEILNGASFKLPSTILGCFEGSAGTILVTGNSGSGNIPSTFESDGSITIGSRARGIVQISAGGRLISSTNVVIGRFETGDGLATLTGANSTWIHPATKNGADAGSVVVGMGGKGSLVIDDLAQFETGELTIGEQGTEARRAEGMMTVSRGGSVRAGGTFVTLGKETHSKGILVLDGADSKFTGIKNQNNGVGATLEIGRHGEGTLILTNGASLNLPSVILSFLAGSTGTVSLAQNSRLVSDGSVTVGMESEGIMEIATGSEVQSYNRVVLGQSEKARGVVKLTDEQSQWQHTSSKSQNGPGQFVVGENGVGQLSILEGATLTAGGSNSGDPALVIGQEENANGSGTVILRSSRKDKASLLLSQGSTVVGQRGTGFVRIEGNGHLKLETKGAFDQFVLGEEKDASGEILLTGAGALLTATNATIEAGREGFGQILVAGQADPAAKVDASLIELGVRAGSTGNLRVEGGHSVVQVETLFIGAPGLNPGQGAPSGLGILSILNGGKVTMKRGALNSEIELVSPADRPSQIKVEGQGSILEGEESKLLIGGPASIVLEPNVSVRSGGKLHTGTAVLGTAGSAARASVTGNNGSVGTWSLFKSDENGNALVVGGQSRGELEIGEYGRVAVRDEVERRVQVGSAAPGSIDVNGEGALLDLGTKNTLFLGQAQASGTLSVNNRGEVLTGKLLGGFGSTIIADSGGYILADRLISIAETHIDILGGTIHAGKPALLNQRIPGALKVSAVNLISLDDKRKLIVGSGGRVAATKMNMESTATPKFDPLGLTFSYSFGVAVAELAGGSIDLGAASGPPVPNTVRVGTGGLLDGIGLINGPQGAAAILAQGGQVWLIPYVIINPLVGQHSEISSSDSGRYLNHSLLSAKAPLATTNTPSTAVSLGIDGNFVLDTNGTVVVEIAGPTPGIEFGVLAATGNVSVKGKLTLAFMNSFAPKRGQTFQLFKAAGATTGQFSAVEVSGLAPGFQYQVTPDGQGGLSLEALSDSVATSSPLLSIGLSDLTIQLSWPVWAAGYFLQSTTNLASGVWLDRPSAGNALSVPAQGPQEFFRLAR